MNPKISIIVPIYNVAGYLSRCLESLLTQSLTDIEIIAVNDGSTDGSGTILRDYANKDKRIVLIEKANGGVSAARNDGILASSGDYLGFVDPDDWIDTDMYKGMYEEAIQEKADIVMCGYIREFGTHAKIKDYELPEKVCYRNEEVRDKLTRRLVGPLHEEIARPELLDAWGTVWSKLYRADLIKNNHVQFIDLNIIGTNEDSLFNIHSSYYANSFVFLNRPYYHYWRASESSLTSGYKAELQNKWYALYGLMEDFLQEKGLNQDYHFALNNRICLNVLGLGLNTISKSNKASVWQKISQINKLLNNNRLKISFQSFEVKHFSIIWKTFYLSAKYSLAPIVFGLLLAIEYLRKMVR